MIKIGEFCLDDSSSHTPAYEATFGKHYKKVMAFINKIEDLYRLKVTELALNKGSRDIVSIKVEIGIKDFKQEVHRKAGYLIAVEDLEDLDNAIRIFDSLFTQTWIQCCRR